MVPSGIFDPGPSDGSVCPRVSASKKDVISRFFPRPP